MWQWNLTNCATQGSDTGIGVYCPIILVEWRWPMSTNGSNSRLWMSLQCVVVIFILKYALAEKHAKQWLVSIYPDWSCLYNMLYLQCYQIHLPLTTFSRLFSCSDLSFFASLYSFIYMYMWSGLVFFLSIN